MSDDEAVAHGTITAKGDSYEIRMERKFECGPGRVWEFLTRSAEIAQWLAPGKIEMRKGGTARLDFADSGIVIDSTVSDLRPPNMIEYSWSGPGEPLRPLRFETKIVPYGTALELTVRIPKSEDAPRTAAGFEAHLEMLAAALEGVPIKFPFPTFKALRDVYKAQMAG